MKITDDFITEEHQKLWFDAVAQYGEDYLVPSPVLQGINNRIRALYCLQKWDGAGSLASFLSTYMVNPEVVADLVDQLPQKTRGATPAETSPKREDRYKVVIEWSKAHVGEEFTTEDLVEISTFSYPTMLKFLQESPHFRKVKKGLWQVRDPQADRVAEKNSL